MLVVAALSARALSEAAARDGFEVVALDLFGDADTRRAAARWLPIGAPGELRIDPRRVLGVLRELAQPGGAIGWIAGSGFEGQPDLLEVGETLLPLIGTAAASVRRVRDPRQFFGALSAHGIAHPAVQMQAPVDPAGWLSKDAHACGGWHIRDAAQPADHAAAPPARYFQRVMRGTPMSATFIADGRDAAVVGFNELLVRPVGARPHVYCGCVGPVKVGERLALRVGEAVRVLSAAFGLRGWCSLDFMRGEDDAIGVLEINPRPPASLALYAPRGQIDAQLRACLHAELPQPGAFTPARVAGNEIVHARHALQLDEATAQRLSRWPGVHDLPVAGACFAPGDPLCTLGAEADGAAQVKALLSAGRNALLKSLETSA